MLRYIIFFLVLLNPIITFIYLQPIIQRMSARNMLSLLLKGSLIAFVVFWIFSTFGNVLFKEVLQINFESFRIFGGVIIGYFSFAIIAHSRESLIEYHEDHDSIVNQIAMPLMIGAGTISVSILIGNRYDIVMSTIILAIILAINFVVIALLLIFRRGILNYFKKDFDKFMNAFLKLFAFFAGAIGIDMIVKGITNLIAGTPL